MLAPVVEAIKRSSGLASKRDIASVMDTLVPGGATAESIRIGDDCAAIPDGDGWLLFAMEGFVNELVNEAPYFAGYCGAVVNISDIAAMGGRPVALIDAIWGRDQDQIRPVMEGLSEASRIYGVPVVGGHSNAHSDQGQLAVAVLGRARRLLTSFDARPGDVLLTAIDLRGAYREPWPNWDASSGQDPQRLRGDLELLPEIAEAGLCVAAKDISMAGVIGTTLMLLECSGVGAVIDIDAVPRPIGVEAARWLVETFPSYGFVLAVAPEQVAEVTQRFEARGIACATVGVCDDTRCVNLREGREQSQVWDFNQTPLMGCV